MKTIFSISMLYPCKFPGNDVTQRSSTNRRSDSINLLQQNVKHVEQNLRKITFKYVISTYYHCGYI